MTLYDGIILTFILIGILIIIVSFLFSKYDHYVENEENKKHLKRVDERVDYDQVRDKILELNEYGEYLKEELNKKHKELLFLYQMILEKQKEIQIESLEKQVDIKSIEKKKINVESNDENKTKINFNKEILDLSLAGDKPHEIAKKLKIGQGQVELVLNLYK
jgi:hypothetical protein